MCKKKFGTKMPDIAALTAKHISRKTGKPFKVYFCTHCNLYRIARKNREVGRSEQRRRFVLRKMIEQWENEGGAIL